MVGKFGAVPQRLEDAALERELRYLRDPWRRSSMGRGWRYGSTPSASSSSGRSTPAACPIGPEPTACEPARKGARARADQPLGQYPRPGPSR
jgi:hypothetical protein